MKCKQITSSSEKCLNNSIIDGMCMSHFLQFLRKKGVNQSKMNSLRNEPLIN